MKTKAEKSKPKKTQSQGFFFDETGKLNFFWEVQKKSQSHASGKTSPIDWDAMLFEFEVTYRENLQRALEGGSTTRVAFVESTVSFKKMKELILSAINDSYQPTNKEALKLKKQGNEDWKFLAMRDEAIRRNIARQVILGTIVPFRVGSQTRYAPSTVLFSPEYHWVGSEAHHDVVSLFIGKSKAGRDLVKRLKPEWSDIWHSTTSR